MILKASQMCHPQIIYKKERTQEKLWKFSRNFPFARDIYIYKEISIYKVFWGTRMRIMTKTLND